MPEATLPEGATEPGTHLDEHSAVAALTAIRTRGEPAQAAKTASPEPKAEPAEHAEPTAAEETEEPQTEAEPSTDDAPADPQAAVDVAAVAKVLGIPESDLVIDADGTVSLKTKVDGQDGTAKLADLRKSHQLDSSFTHKSMQLAEERKTFDQQRQAVVTDLTQQKEALSSGIRLATQLLHGEFANVNWDKLKAENFNDYLVIKDQFETRQRSLQSLYATLNQGDQDKLNQQKEELHAWRQQQAKDIVNHFPEWKDAKVAEPAIKAIYDTAKSVYGVTQAELDQLYDSRYVRILSDAKKWRDLQGKKPGVMQRVNQAPALAKPGTTQKPNQTKLKDAQARFGQSHSEKDGVAVLRSLRLGQ